MSNIFFQIYNVYNVLSTFLVYYSTVCVKKQKVNNLLKKYFYFLNDFYFLKLITLYKKLYKQSFKLHNFFLKATKNIYFSLLLFEVLTAVHHKKYIYEGLQASSSGFTLT